MLLEVVGVDAVALGSKRGEGRAGRFDGGDSRGRRGGGAVAIGILFGTPRGSREGLVEV